MGYRRARRLRSSETTFLPRLARHPYLLRRRLARFTRQRTREVDFRSLALLLWLAHHSCRL